MSVNARRALRSAGLLLSVLALAWIGLRFYRGGGIELLHNLPISAMHLGAALLVGAVAYLPAMFLLALAWWRMLAALSPQPPPALPTMATYAVSQYGKYLPGNVAHYALRHAWSRRYGIPHESLGLAAVLEAVLLLLAALGLTLFADARGTGLTAFIDARLAIALLLAGLIVLGLALHWLRRRGGIGRLRTPALPPPLLLVCVPIYAGFFVLGTLVLAGLARVLGIDLGVGIAAYALLLAANAASWLAGFVIIGAPAGLGVREATFVALAGAALGEGQALLLIGLFRVVTFLGDTLFLAAGALLLRLAARRSQRSQHSTHAGI